jgi:hypothetical protein
MHRDDEGVYTIYMWVDIGTRTKVHLRFVTYLSMAFLLQHGKS